MGITATYDISTLASRVSDMAGMLYGSGASEGEIDKMLKVETGQLAGKIANSVGPKNYPSAMKKITWEMKKHLAFLPMGSNLKSQESESYAEFTWLYASPKAVVGVNNEDDMRSASGEEAFSAYRSSQNLTREGYRYVELGWRSDPRRKSNPQHIMRINRMVVSKSAFNYVRNQIGSTVGELRAAFFAVAKKYIPQTYMPPWVSSKIEAVKAKGKSKVAEYGMGTPQAAIEFQIAARGIVSNEVLVSKINGAIKWSQESVRAKCQKILRGAKYLFETGQVYFERD